MDQKILYFPKVMRLPSHGRHAEQNISSTPLVHFALLKKQWRTFMPVLRKLSSLLRQKTEDSNLCHGHQPEQIYTGHASCLKRILYNKLSGSN